MAYSLKGGLFMMIRLASEQEFETIYEIINDAAMAYKGIIPTDRWHEPYMSQAELAEQIVDGVQFYGYCEDDRMVGVMGIQDKGEVVLIRHAYVRTEKRNRGIGGILLKYLCDKTVKPILIGAWQDAVWAVRFYEKNGFALVASEDKDALLQKYWKIPSRQVETSVVLADGKWFERST
jgi:N-acetylglutamate synthase-like GNAT family acetyltransferase